MIKRRRLVFKEFENVAADLKRLSTEGYAAVGAWNLIQICRHLTLMFLASMSGFETPIPWLVRKVSGPFQAHRTLRSGQIPAGLRAPPVLLSKAPPGQTETEAVQLLRRAMGKFREHRGDLAAHPTLGQLSAAQWKQYHLIHCAHHLSFLIPSSVIELLDTPLVRSRDEQEQPPAASAGR